MMCRKVQVCLGSIHAYKDNDSAVGKHLESRPSIVCHTVAPTCHPFHCCVHGFHNIIHHHVLHSSSSFTPSLPSLCLAASASIPASAHQHRPEACVPHPTPPHPGCIGLCRCVGRTASKPARSPLDRASKRRSRIDMWAHVNANKPCQKERTVQGRCKSDANGKDGR